MDSFDISDEVDQWPAALGVPKADQSSGRERNERHELLCHVLGAMLTGTDLELDKDRWRERAKTIVEAANYIVDVALEEQ